MASGSGFFNADNHDHDDDSESSISEASFHEEEGEEEECKKKEAEMMQEDGSVSTRGSRIARRNCFSEHGLHETSDHSLQVITIYKQQKLQESNTAEENLLDSTVSDGSFCDDSDMDIKPEKEGTESENKEAEMTMDCLPPKEGPPKEEDGSVSTRGSSRIARRSNFTEHSLLGTSDHSLQVITTYKQQKLQESSEHKQSNLRKCKSAGDFYNWDKSNSSKEEAFYSWSNHSRQRCSATKKKKMSLSQIRRKSKSPLPMKRTSNPSSENQTTSVSDLNKKNLERSKSLTMPPRASPEETKESRSLPQRSQSLNGEHAILREKRKINKRNSFMETPLDVMERLRQRRSSKGGKEEKETPESGPDSAPAGKPAQRMTPKETEATALPGEKQELGKKIALEAEAKRLAEKKAALEKRILNLSEQSLKGSNHSVQSTSSELTADDIKKLKELKARKALKKKKKLERSLSPMRRKSDSTGLKKSPSIGQDALNPSMKRFSTGDLNPSKQEPADHEELSGANHNLAGTLSDQGLDVKKFIDLKKQKATEKKKKLQRDRLSSCSLGVGAKCPSTGSMNNSTFLEEANARSPAEKQAAQKMAQEATGARALAEKEAAPERKDQEEAEARASAAKEAAERKAPEEAGETKTQQETPEAAVAKQEDWWKAAKIAQLEKLVEQVIKTEEEKTKNQGVVTVRDTSTPAA